MRILFVGDIVGSAGRAAFAGVTADLRANDDVDFVIANAENAAGGKGLTLKLANTLFDAGADVLTLGDHAWDQKDLCEHLDEEPRIVRAANFAPGCPGNGFVTVQCQSWPVTVVNCLGRVFMRGNDCPFRAMDRILADRAIASQVVLVDFHAEATSEKIAMRHYLDGRVSALVGTHTHVQTADEMITEKGTAYLTDLGMTGPIQSVIGRETESVMKTFLYGMPSRFTIAKGPTRLEGALVTVDPNSRKATDIRRIRRELT